MSVLSLFGKGLDLIGSVLGADGSGIINKVKEVIAGNPEVQKQLQELELEEKKLIIQENESIRELYKAELKQDDKFISRARPAMLWLCLGLLTLIFGVIPFFNMIAGWFGLQIATIEFPVLPAELYWLIGSIFGLYTGARSVDKVKKGKG